MPINNMITRYPNGLTNAFDNDVFNNLTVPNRTVYHEFSEDFDKYTATQWSVGGVNPVTPALAAGDGGILSMATTGANNDSNWIQQAGNAWTITQGTPSVAGKAMAFRVLAQLDDATLGLFAAGFQVPVSGNNFLTPANGLFLRKPAGGAALYLVHRIGGVETLSAPLGNLTNAAPFEASFYYDGLNTVVASLNGAVRASITVNTLSTSEMRVTAGVSAGSGAPRTMRLDLLWAAKAR